MTSIKPVEIPKDAPAADGMAAASDRLPSFTAPRIRVMARIGSTMIIVTISRLAPIRPKVFRPARAPKRTDAPPRVRR